MNGTKIFEDSYCGVFAKQDEFLECLESIGRNSFWERKKSKNLRLVPITDDSRVAEELREKCPIPSHWLSLPMLDNPGQGFPGKWKEAGSGG